MPRHQFDTIAKRKMKLWREAVFDLSTGKQKDDVATRRMEKLTLWREDPWAYLKGKDVPDEEFPKGRPIIWTADERDDETPVKPFPRDKPYLQYLTMELWAHRLVFMDKVRQMYCTTLCALNADWYGSFVDEREIFVSRLKEDSAIKLINDKIRDVHKRKPRWLQAACPMSSAPAHQILYENTRSTITGVGQTFAISDARGPTGSLILVDEAAFQSYFPEIYTAVLPMVTRLWAITTANIGDPGADLFKALIREGRQDDYEEGESQEAGSTVEAETPTPESPE